MESTTELLAALIAPLARQEGLNATHLEAVRLIRTSESQPRAPIVYEPGIIIVAQGRKRVFLGEQALSYDPNNYLVLSVPLPLECETIASPEAPLLAVSIRTDPAQLGELLIEMEDEEPGPGLVQGIYATALTEDLACATQRLLECLAAERDSRILGPSIVREILYRVLCGEQGGALRAVAARHGRFGQIARVLKHLHSSYAEEQDIESLARAANMSVSNFHHSFKAVTSTSPLQYLKSLRLHKARVLMHQQGLSAAAAADRVGYASASQFSREFKRFFGSSPAADAALPRSAQAA